MTKRSKLKMNFDLIRIAIFIAISFSLIGCAQKGPEAADLNTILLNADFETGFELIDKASECPKIRGEVAFEWFDNSCWEGNYEADIEFAKTTDAHSGEFAQRVEIKDRLVNIGQTVNFKSGQIYSASIWLKADSAMNVTLLLRKAGYPYSYYAQKILSLNNTWTKYNLSGLPLPGEGFFMITSEDKGVFYMDDAALGSSLIPSNPITSSTIPKSYFGLHIHSSEISWPDKSLNIGTVRLWDASGNKPPSDDAQWAAINTAEGVYDWTSLDKHVNRAIANGAEIVFNLARTPQWASARPDEYSPYGSGQAAEPANDKYWQDWVRAVASRYKGKIKYWEIWNEPNYDWFWTGSTEKLVDLTKQARDILKSIDADNKIISPSPYDMGYLAEFLEYGGGDYVDIIGYHFYLDDQAPEFLYNSYVPTVKSIMANYGQNKPLWDTENGWPGQQLATNKAIGYLARAYLLEWAAGVGRFYFYAWDENNDSVILADYPDYSELNPVGIAYAELSDWLIGSKMLNINTEADDTWIIELQQADNSKAYIVWNPKKQINFDIPSSWQIAKMRDLSGQERSLTSSGIMVDNKPILLEAR